MVAKMKNIVQNEILPPKKEIARTQEAVAITLDAWTTSQNQREFWL